MSFRCCEGSFYRRYQIDQVDAVDIDLRDLTLTPNIVFTNDDVDGIHRNFLAAFTAWSAPAASPRHRCYHDGLHDRSRPPYRPLRSEHIYRSGSSWRARSDLRF